MSNEEYLEITLSDLELKLPDTIEPVRRTTEKVTGMKRAAQADAAPLTRSKKVCPATNPQRKTQTKKKTKRAHISSKSDTSEDEEREGDEDDRDRPGPSRPYDGVTAYQEGVYRRLDNIAAKLDTLVNIMAESTRQVKVLSDTVGLQQTRIESIQTSVTKSVTQTPSLYPSLSASAPVSHTPVTHTQAPDLTGQQAVQVEL